MMARADVRRGHRRWARRKHAGASLLPSGHSLDLFVTLTDYHGYHQLVQIHDPPLIHELEHHHVLHFTYRRTPSGEVESDFGLDNAPALAFAARATSSFPGAFPPARIVEMDEVVARAARHLAAARRVSSPAISPAICGPSVDPATALVHRRLGAQQPAVPARRSRRIHGRPAYRQVDRRLVYIDPDPAPPVAAPQPSVPGFFRHPARRACRIFRSSQPVTDELSWVIDFNEQVGGVRAIIEARGRRSASWSRRSIADAARPARSRPRSCAPGASR